MNQRYIDNTKKSQLKDNQPGILKIYVFCQKIQQRGSGPGDSTAGITYLSTRIHPKCCHISPKNYHIFPKSCLQLYLVVQWRAQLQHSSHIVKIGVEATW